MWFIFICVCVRKDFNQPDWPWKGPGLCSKLTPTPATFLVIRLSLPPPTSSSRACSAGTAAREARRREEAASTCVRQLGWPLWASVSMPTSTTTGWDGWRGCCQEAASGRWLGRSWWISWSRLLSPSAPFTWVSAPLYRFILAAFFFCPVKWDFSWLFSQLREGLKGIKMIARHPPIRNDIKGLKNWWIGDIFLYKLWFDFPPWFGAFLKWSFLTFTCNYLWSEHTAVM